MARGIGPTQAYFDWLTGQGLVRAFPTIAGSSLCDINKNFMDMFRFTLTQTLIRTLN